MIGPAGREHASALLVRRAPRAALATSVVADSRPAAVVRAHSPAELISTNPGTGAVTYSRPSISGDGNIVVFSETHAGTVAAPPPPQGWVRNRSANQLTQIPIPSGVDFNGAVHPVVSRDGCSVVFWSHFDVGGWTVFKWNRCAANAQPVPITPRNFTGTSFGQGQDLAIDATGRFVAVIATGSRPADLGGTSDAVARIDTANGNAVASNDTLFGANVPMFANDIDISDNGLFVAVEATTQPNRAGSSVIGWTPDTNAVEVVSQAGGGVNAGDEKESPSVSADGRFVAFTSARDQDNPVFVNPQLFVRDRVAGTNQHVTVGPPPAQGDDRTSSRTSTRRATRWPSPTARTLSQVSCRRCSSPCRGPGRSPPSTVEPVSFGTNDQLIAAGATQPAISATGRFIAFSSGSDVEFGPFPANDNRIDVCAARAPAGTVDDAGGELRHHRRRARRATRGRRW